MKILYITSRFPFPIDKGDKLRAFHQIRTLSKSHEIFLFSLAANPSSNSLSQVKQYCSNIFIGNHSKFGKLLNLFKAIFNELPFQVSYFYSSRNQKIIDNVIRELKPDLVYCQLIRMAEYVKNIKDISKVVDYVDVISKGLERRINSSNYFMRLLIREEFNRVKKYEREIFKKFDRQIIITKQDRDHLPFPENQKVDVVPNGVDFDYFKYKELKKKYDIMFVGNLSYPPNITAAHYLVSEILPEVLKKKKNIKILIVGASPSKSLLKLKNENVEVKSWVNDIRESYLSGKIFVAPMQIGTGLQNKLLEAMALCLPCITSPLALCALGAEANKEILVGTSPKEYASHIMHLLDDTEFYSKISLQGNNFVSKKYNWVNTNNRILTILSEVNSEN